MLWGTLLVGSALVDLPAEGVSVVAARLLPERSASLWAWLNALTVPLALVVWGLVGARLALDRSRP